jgi:exodeoxyribonuclease III
LNDFIRKHKELLPLTAETLKTQAQLKKQVKQTDILEKYRNAKEVYIDVRCRAIFSYEWYSDHFESLPNVNTHLYLIKATATGKRTNRNITVKLEAEKTFLRRPKLVPLDNWDYNTYVYTQDELNFDNCTIVETSPAPERSNLIADGVYHHKIQSLDHEGNDKMTVLLLNVCSLRAAWNKGLLNYLVATPHDVLVLTETRLPATKWQETKQAFHDLGYRTVGRTTTKTEANAAGILIATTLSKAHGEMGITEQAIDTECDGRVLELSLQFPPITLVAAYLPCYNTEVTGRSEYAPKYMKCFASKYRHALQNARERGREYLICADLQVAITDLDQTDNAVEEGSGSTTAERQALQELFTDTTYTDFYRMCNPTTRDFTSKAAHTQWTGKPNGTAEVGKRIDYILGSANLHPDSCIIDHTPLIHKISDHAAVIATIQYRNVYPPLLAQYFASEKLTIANRSQKHTHNELFGEPVSKLSSY